MTIPAHEPVTDPKSWYRSRTIIGGLVAALATLLSLWGLEVNQVALTDLLLAVGALVGSAMAIYGRVQAEQPIRRKNNQEQINGSKN